MIHIVINIVHQSNRGEINCKVIVKIDHFIAVIFFAASFFGPPFRLRGVLEHRKRCLARRRQRRRLLLSLLSGATKDPVIPARPAGLSLPPWDSTGVFSLFSWVFSLALGRAMRTDPRRAGVGDRPVVHERTWQTRCCSSERSVSFRRWSVGGPPTCVLSASSPDPARMRRSVLGRRGAGSSASVIRRLLPVVPGSRVVWRPRFGKTECWYRRTPPERNPSVGAGFLRCTSAPPASAEGAS